METYEKELKKLKRTKTFLILSIIFMILMLIVTVYSVYTEYATIVMQINKGDFKAGDEAILANALFARIVGSLYLPLYLTLVGLAGIIVFATLKKKRRKLVRELKADLRN